MRADLTTLLELQDRDTAVRAVQDEIQALNPEIERLDAELKEAEAQLEVAKNGAGEADRKRADLEGRIESYRVMQERRRQRLDWVKGAKEASTLMAELDLARSVLAKEESEWLRSAGAVQEAEKRVAEAQERVDEVRAAQAPKREEIRGTVAEFEVTLVAAAAKRDESSQSVRADLLMAYQRVLRGRAPRALYPLKGGACGHCFTAVPLHRRHEIQNAEAFAPCEACGVLIYLDEDAT